MDGREAMATSGAASQYYIQYRDRGNDGELGYGSQGGLLGPSGIRSILSPNASLPMQSSHAGGGSVKSSFQAESPSPSSLSPHGAGAGGPVGESQGEPSQGEPVKRKRGRPRKYLPDGTVSLALLPRSSSPQGSELAMGTAASVSGSGSAKRGRGRPPGTGIKQQLASLGEWIAGSAGMGFTPHIITIAIGEDIATKIMSFSQQGPRAVCILSANGTVSTVTLRQTATSGDSVTYEGPFEILCMSGSYLLTDDGGSCSRSGGLSISLSSPDGRVIGGGVGGLLVAGSLVQVIVGSFIYGGSKAKNKMKSIQGPGGSEPSKQGTPTSTTPGQNLASPPVMEGWPSSNQMDTRNSHDIDLMRD